MDLALDETTGELALLKNDLYLVQNNDAIRQHLTQRLRFFLGEWFLDESQGIPYFDRIFIKNPNPVAVDSILKTAILESPGVIELISFNLDINFTTRRLRLDFEARSEFGPIVFSDTLEV